MERLNIDEAGNANPVFTPNDLEWEMNSYLYDHPDDVVWKDMKYNIIQELLRNIFCVRDVKFDMSGYAIVNFNDKDNMRNVIRNLLDINSPFSVTSYQSMVVKITNLERLLEHESRNYHKGDD